MIAKMIGGDNGNVDCDVYDGLNQLQLFITQGPGLIRHKSIC